MTSASQDCCNHLLAALAAGTPALLLVPRGSSVRYRVTVTTFPELERIVELNVELVKGVVSSMTVPSPAYALGLWAEDPELIAPTVVCIGLDASRELMLSGPDRRSATTQVWNVSDYDLDAIPEPGPRTDPDFASLEPLVWMRLRAAEVVDPTEFVLNRVALSLARAPIIAPRTSDFVVFAFNEDFGERLRENVEFAATREVVAELEAKGLLPARFEVPSEDEWPLHDEAAERRSSRDRSRTGNPPRP